MEKNNVFNVCKDCSNQKRIKFQKTNYMEILKSIQSDLEERLKSKKDIGYYVAKIPFQYLEKHFNENNNQEYFVNYYNEDDNNKVEHMWMVVLSVNFDEETICGVLANDSLCFDIERESIVIAKFKHIEDLQPME